jgi:Rrf2 family protein
MAHAENAVTAKTIAADLGVSKDHLSKVLNHLSRVNLVTAQRGPRGGFVLGRDPGTITLLEIIETIDGPLAEDDCLMGQPLCGSACILSGLARSIRNQVHSTLSSTPLTALPRLPLDKIQ